jgi:hypothetical protein
MIKNLKNLRTILKVKIRLFCSIFSTSHTEHTVDTLRLFDYSSYLVVRKLKLGRVVIHIRDPSRSQIETRAGTN